MIRRSNVFLRVLTASLACAVCALVQAAGPSAPIRAMQLPMEACGKNHYILSSPADCIWVPTAELNAARAGHTATLLNDGRVLVVGGTDDIALSAELYDPRTGRWTLTGALNRNRKGHTATLLPNGKVLVLGGDSRGWDAALQELILEDSSELFDPATGSWVFTASMSVTRTGFTATLVATGKVLVVGGVDRRDETLTSAELYDPQTQSWMAAGNSGATYGHTATLLADGRVLVVGGVADDFWGVPVTAAETYDPNSGEWTGVGGLHIARNGHAATLLANGTVLVSGGWERELPGGYAEFWTLSEVERFDPVTGSWTIADALATPRYSHTATLLPDGSVLVAGGLKSIGNVPRVTYATLDSSELSSSNGDAWFGASGLNAARFDHTATLLPDGSVLVAGGSVLHGYVATPLKSAEIYKSAAASPGQFR